MRRSKIFKPSDMPTWWFFLSASLMGCLYGFLIFVAFVKLAHANERWLNRYTLDYPRHCLQVDNPDDGLVSGPTPQVCARPQRPSETAGARPGLLDPRQPERSFAR